jgi:hypothetical protein
VQVAPLDPQAGDSVSVSSPVKAHLLDGSTVVFRDGVDVVRDTIRGDGTRYSLTLQDSVAVTSLVLDSVAGMEVFRTRVDNGTSVLVSLLATGATAVGAAALAVAIFGSCPTYYADSAVGRPSAAEDEALGRVVEHHQAALRALLPGDAQTLAHCWSALFEDVRAAVRPEVWERLQVLR